MRRLRCVTRGPRLTAGARYTCVPAEVVMDRPVVRSRTALARHRPRALPASGDGAAWMVQRP
jgi:hypothetical protein